MSEVDESLRKAFAAMRGQANDQTRLRPSLAREAEHRFLDDMEAAFGFVDGDPPPPGERGGG